MGRAMITNANTSEILRVSGEILQRLHWLDTPYGRFPSKPGDGGDDCLWNGLLSSVGWMPSVDAVGASQARTPSEARFGMFYRNPLRRSNDNVGHPAFFSRDMATGVLAWLASGFGDYFAAHSWQKYWESQEFCVIKKPWPFRGCLVSGYRFAPDDRSVITPKMFALLGRVWKQRGWPTTAQMDRFKGSDNDYDVIETRVCDIGYQLHLHACDAWIKRIMGQSHEYSDKVANICFDRSPTNLFYKLLAQGESHPRDVESWLELCSLAPQGEFGKSWIWEKEDRIESIPDACGWDLFFMAKLLMKLG